MSAQQRRGQAPGAEEFEVVPASLLGSCEQCGIGARRTALREFDGRTWCGSCFTAVLEAARGTIAGLALEISEPDRLCSNCRAMVDPSVGSLWCSVLELGPKRATLCDNFVPLNVHEPAVTSPDPPPTTQDLQALWDVVLGGLSNSLNSTHAGWLADATPVALEDNVLHVGVANEQTRMWLAARFGPAISRSLELNGYPHITVDFCQANIPFRAPDAIGVRGENNPEDSCRQASPQLINTRHMGLATNERSPSGQAPTRPTERGWVTGLNPANTFERFVVGTGNRLAHAGALGVASGTKASYNPLFLHGGVGVGKTHLLQAIAARRIEGGQRAAYISSETFTNELISAIRGGNTGSFRARYRDVDLLLVDDIHFIAGKDSTQEEFFHTFDALYNGGKQIVLSSDRPPHELRVLEERLRSRFSWGLLADMQPPDLLTKVEILKARLAERGRAIAEDVLSCLASQTTQNVRELEGLLNRLLALSDLHGVEPSLAIASGLVTKPPRAGHVTSDEILQAVAAYYRVTVSALSGKQRTRAVSLPRHVAMFLMREDASLSLPTIGHILGGRDHTTIMYGCTKVTRNLEHDQGLRNDVDAIRGLVASCVTPGLR